MKKILLMLLMVGICLINFTSALDDQGIGKVGENFSFIQTCSDANYITLSTIQYPNRSVEIINTNMSSMGGGSYQYNFTDIVAGRYDVTGISDGCTNTFATYFEVTPNGTVLTTGEAFLYTLMVIFFVLLDLLVLYLIIILPSKNEKDESGLLIRIVNLKYVRFVLIGIFYPMIIVTLNLLNGLAVNFANLGIFSGVVGFLFLTMLRVAWIYTVIIILWILYNLIKDTNDRHLIKKGAKTFVSTNTGRFPWS